MFQENKTRQIFRKKPEYFLPPDICVHETPILRFAFFPYFRRTQRKYNSQFNFYGKLYYATADYKIPKYIVAFELHSKLPCIKA